MKISVIIPTFNRANVLSRAIESVLSQTYAPFEVIVVDDGSSDSTRSLVKNYPSVKYLKIDNSGVSKARNVGIDSSKGDWIALLDSDDEWLPNKLELQVALSESNSLLNLIHGEEIWIRDGVRVNQMNKHKKSGGDIFIRSLKLCLISPSAVLIRKSLFDEVGLFAEDYPVCEDYDLWLKITANEDVGFVSEPIIRKYGGHDDQLSRKYFAMDYWRVKSIDFILKYYNLSVDKKEQAIKVLLKKARILLKGYEKHQNLEHYDEVDNIRQKYLH